MIKALARRPDSLARVAAQRARLRFVNGVEWLLRDPKTVVGRTPWEPVYEDGKLVVRRYHLPKRRTVRYRTPVLLIPPLMVKPFVFDLYPGRSMVWHLLEAGFPVYLVDFGEPDRADAYVTLDDYVLQWVPDACAAVRSDAGARQLSVVGYCMGALFGICHVAANGDNTVKNIVGIGAPFDTHKMGLFAWVAKNGADQVELVAKRMGNVPGRMSSAAFRMIAPVKNVTRYADLFMNMYDREFVNGFDAMNQWTGQFVDYPQGAFIQFMREFMQKNKLVRGKMKFGDKLADLADVQSSMLLFAGQTDQIAPEPAVRAGIKAVGSDDVTLEIVPGGHMGVLAGSRAPEAVWTPTAEWLGARSTRKTSTKKKTSKKKTTKRTTKKKTRKR